MTKPQITIIVVPRERFQFTQDGLESLYNNTRCPFRLIYIDNNSPKKTKQYLVQQALARKFNLIQLSHYHSPNQARNIGLRRVKTPYVVFVDNDVVFAPGWLEALLQCSQETGASVVGSLVCQYQPLHTIVHCVGGDYMNTADYVKFSRGERGPMGTLTDAGQWEIEEKTYFQNKPVAEVKGHLHRKPVGFVEFHAMLVRTSLFDRIGLLDEGCCCTKEYIDFCMSVTRAGGLVYFDPTSVVTFLTHPPAPRLQWRDLPYFMLRWSDEWEFSSLVHFQQKWNLANNSYFQKRFKKLGQRRRKEMIKPIAAKFSFLGKPITNWLENLLVVVEKLLNRSFSRRYRLARKTANATHSSKTGKKETQEIVRESASKTLDLPFS